MDDTLRQTRKGRLVIRSQHRRGSIRAAIFTTILHTMALTCLLSGTLQLYCISQGADDLYLGILSCFIWAGAPFLLLGMVLMRRFGKRRILLFWSGVMPLISVSFMALLPVAGRYEVFSPRWILSFLLAMVLLRSITDSIGGAGWFPLLQDNVPSRITGKFFGTFRIYWQTSQLIITLLIAWFLGKDPAWWKFSVVFAVGQISFLFKIYFLSRLKEKPPSHQSDSTVSVRQVFRQIWANQPLRYYVGYILMFNIAVLMVLPFQIKYLKELGYTDGYIVFAISMISLGAILSLRFWGRLADRFGNRSIFTFSHVGMIVTLACWLLVGHNPFSAVFVFVLYGLWSIFQSANGIAQTRHMFQVVPETNQSLMVAINVVLALSISLSPLIGGLCLRLLSEVQVKSGAVVMNRYHMLFLLSAILVVIPHAMHKRFQADQDRSTTEVFAVVIRPLRNLFGSFVFFSRNQRKDD